MPSYRRHPPTGLQDFKRQRCSVCKCEDKFNFHIPDEIWGKVVPEQFRRKVVCLPCFDAFAMEKNVSYSDSLNELFFAGDKASVKFDVASSEDV